MLLGCPQGIAVAQIAADQLTCGNGDRSSLHRESPGHCRLGQDGASSPKRVAGSAAPQRVGFQETFVTVDPILVVHRVHAVRAVKRNGQTSRQVARGALGDGSRVALELDWGHVVVRYGRSRSGEDRPVGVRAPVAPFAENPGMGVLAEPVEDPISIRRLVFGKTAVGGLNGLRVRIVRSIGLQEPDAIRRRDDVGIGPCNAGQGVASVAGLAARLGCPRNTLGQIRAAWKGHDGESRGEVIADLAHAAMAVLTDDAAVEHGPSQAPGRLAGMALVACLIESS